MKKLKKALSVLLASATLASACPTHQKACALTPAEAAVIGIFGAGALAGGVAAVCLGVQNANIKNELKKEKEAKKDNPAGQSSELTRSQLDKAMRELATVKAQLENAKKEQESCSEELTKYKQELEQSEGKRTRSASERDELSEKIEKLSQQNRMLEQSVREKDAKLNAQRQQHATSDEQSEKLSEQVNSLNADIEILSKKYNELMLHSIACRYLLLAHENKNVKEAIDKLKKFKKNSKKGIYGENITVEDLASLLGYYQNNYARWVLADSIRKQTVFEPTEQTDASKKELFHAIAGILTTIHSILSNSPITSQEYYFIRNELPAAYCHPDTCKLLYKKNPYHKDAEIFFKE